MHAILLALGILVTVAGGAMAAFGLANNGFDIGNTMISAGTTGVVGGLVIVALAAVARELRAARMPENRGPSRPAVAAPAAAPAPTVRAASSESPSPAPAAAVADLSQVLVEPPSEPIPPLPVAQPSAPAPLAPASPADTTQPAGDPFAPPPRADAQRRASPRERGFDAVWAPESAKAVPSPARPAAEPNRESEPVAIRPTREPQAVSVLKSGVIEGMAYTLYSDGSIEADLPEGMVRFGSIDALRRHLSGQG
jgi:hypothetical protein